MTPEKLLELLPEGQFHIRGAMYQIMDYSPSQRFPNPKYEFWEVMASWYELIQKGKVQTDDGIMGSKCK